MIVFRFLIVVQVHCIQKFCLSILLHLPFETLQIVRTYISATFSDGQIVKSFPPKTRGYMLQKMLHYCCGFLVEKLNFNAKGPRPSNLVTFLRCSLDISPETCCLTCARRDQPCDLGCVKPWGVIPSRLSCEMQRRKQENMVTTIDIELERVFHGACFWLYMRMLLLKWFIFLHAPLLLRFNLGMAHFWRKKNNPNLSARLINYKPSHCEVQAMSTNARTNPWISCHFFPNTGRVYSQQKPRWHRWRLDVQSNFHHV